MKKIIVFSLLCLGIFAIIFIRRVGTGGMSASIKTGDFVLLWSREVREGDVVAIQNPLVQYEDIILRRVIALKGVVSYDRNGSILRSGKRISQQDMGNIEPHRIIEERIDTVYGVKKWLIQRKLAPIILDFPEMIVPEGFAFVLADRRDEEIDSRYWGAIPLHDIQGVVVLRLGMPDRWNSWYTILP